MINYQIIQDSIDFYTSKGFQRIEAPWTVTKAISDITKPKDAGDFTILEKNKVLVASGEQSFLYLYNKGLLPKGKFQTVTPCFREEPFDEFHSKYFIKNELIVTDNLYKNIELDLAHDALIFFNRYLKRKAQIIKTNNSYDIVCDNIELGSYGRRKCSFLKWVYGTGVAENRLSRVIEKYK